MTRSRARPLEGRARYSSGVSTTYRRMVAAGSLRSKREELARLVVLADQLHARMDILRAEIEAAEDPWAVDKDTPVVDILPDEGT